MTNSTLGSWDYARECWGWRLAFSSSADDAHVKPSPIRWASQSVQYMDGCTFSELDIVFYQASWTFLCHHLIYPYVIEAFHFSKLVGIFCPLTCFIRTALTQSRSGQDNQVDAAYRGRTCTVTYHLCHFSLNIHVKVGQGFYKLNSPQIPNSGTKFLIGVYQPGGCKGPTGCFWVLNFKSETIWRYTLLLFLSDLPLNPHLVVVIFRLFAGSTL